MTVERIKSMRKFFTKNYQAIDSKLLFSQTISSYDIDGGQNFEEEIDHYKIGDKHWLCEHVIEKTIQPAYGQTITSTRENSTHELTDEELLNVLNKYPEALKALEVLESSLADKGYCIPD